LFVLSPTGSPERDLVGLTDPEGTKKKACQSEPVEDSRAEARPPCFDGAQHDSLLFCHGAANPPWPKSTTCQ